MSTQGKVRPLAAGSFLGLDVARRYACWFSNGKTMDRFADTGEITPRLQSAIERAYFRARRAEHRDENRIEGLRQLLRFLDHVPVVVRSARG